MIIFSIQLVSAVSHQLDDSNDIRGLKITGENTYEILDETSAYTFIDIVNISWINDSLSYNISLEFQGTVDPAKIINEEVFGWVSFANDTDMNGFALDTPLIASFTKSSTGAEINDTVIINDGDEYNFTYTGGMVIDGHYINWSIPAQLFENFSASYAKYLDWKPSVFVIYTFSQDDVDYIYWDTLSWDSFWDTIWEELDYIKDFVPGYHTILILGISISMIPILAKKLKIQSRNTRVE
jgi:hypothetical protein